MCLLQYWCFQLLNHPVRVVPRTLPGSRSRSVEARQHNAVKRVLACWLRCDVIVLDEVGYVSPAEIGAEFLVPSNRRASRKKLKRRPSLGTPCASRKHSNERGPIGGSPNESARTPSASGAFEATAKFGVELIDVG